MKKIIFNEKGKKLPPKAIKVIAEVANKVDRKYSSSFKVMDIEKVTIEDIAPNEKLKYIPVSYNEPVFGKDTPLAIQKLVIDAYLYQKNHNGFLYTTEVPINLCVAADCQRTLDVSRVLKIAANFSTEQFTPVQLTYINGTNNFKIENGQHHAAAAKMLNLEEVPATISFDKTPEQIAENFESQDDLKKRLNQIARCDAGIQAGYLDYLTMEKVSNLFRIKIAGNVNDYPKTINSIRAVKRIVANYGEEGLKFVYQMLIDAGWENQAKAYTECALNIGFGLLELINNNKGDFNYDNFIKEAKQFKDVDKYLDYIHNCIEPFTVKKHPEKTPVIYLQKTYGK